MRFEFGRNWADFSRRALTDARVVQARADFEDLFDGVACHGRTFLDIGFGQGLSLLCAASLGARTLGCDIDPLCADVLRLNAARFPDVSPDAIPVVIGSILDDATQREIRAHADGGFDIVHSWGALHHTGDLACAVRVAGGLVAARGHLVVAIYNRHWSSPFWRPVKWLYGVSPNAVRRVLVVLLYPVIRLAKRLVTGRPATEQHRGMDFYYDVVDWVGGYPYEYATVARVRALAADAGFELVTHRSPRVPTGCNEFVFRKTVA